MLVPINTRFKGGEAAHYPAFLQGRVLFTVRASSERYPAMLEEEDLPDLDRMILLHDAPSNPSRRTTAQR